MFKKLIRAYKEYQLIKSYKKLFEISLYKTSDIQIPTQEMKKNATLESLKQRKYRITKYHRLADGTFDNLDGMLQYGIANLLYNLRIKDFSNAIQIALVISATYFRIALYANRMNREVGNKKEEVKDETADKSGSARSETENAEEHNL
jgi:hypothetical protein